MVAFQDPLHEFLPISTQISAHIGQVLTTFYCAVKTTVLKGIIKVVQHLDICA